MRPLMPTTPQAPGPVKLPSSPAGPRRIRDYVWRYRGYTGLGLLTLLATNLLALFLPSLLGRAIDQVRQGYPASVVAGTAWLIAAVALAAALVRIASRGFLFYAGRSAEHDIRTELFDHLCLQPPSYFRASAVGDLVSRATNDLSNVRALLGFGVLTIVNTVLVFLGNIPLLFILDLPLALVTLATVPALTLLTRWGARAIFLRSQELQKALGDLSSRITENLAGIGVVRSFGREQAEIEAFNAFNQHYYDASVRLVWVRNILWPMAGVLFGIGTLAVLGYGGLRVMDGALSLGEFVEFNARLAALAWPTIAIGWVAGMWQRGLASMERINEVFSQVPTIRDDDDAIEHEIRGGLSARGLTVAYAGSDEPVLRDIRFEVPAGGVLGVVGKTGSGKSTLVRALLRLVEIPSGQLFVDGLDATKLRLATLRRAVGYADQDAFLFSDSLAANIRFARPDAPDDALQHAVDLVRLRADLQALPAGLETLVGERGVTLSGGQRQRTTLARALLAEPRLLILDDSLSAVDAETEAAILQDLRQVARQQTTVIVSHRLSAVRDADQIVVLDQGRVIEQGSHDELVARQGSYADLWRQQTAERELEVVGGGT
ncbi:MAG: ABC transporter ATP-binding protein [Pseudomonadota bacterium]